MTDADVDRAQIIDTSFQLQPNLVAPASVLAELGIAADSRCIPSVENTLQLGTVAATWSQMIHQAPRLLFGRLHQLRCSSSF